MLSIDTIRTDGGTQSRAEINETVVADYANAMNDPETVFPPVVVYHDGKDYWLADGFHRLSAWKQLGRAEIPADVRQGDRRRAILHSVQANANHGLQRTNEDKRRAVITLLDDAEWVGWSDREIARQCRVDHKTVGKIRQDYLGNSPDSRTVERAGTVYQQSTKQTQETPVVERSRHAIEPVGSFNSARQVPALEPDKGQNQPDPKHSGGLSALTREGLEDEVSGLREENAELRKQNQSKDSEIRLLKDQLKSLSQSDHGRIIGRLTKERDTAKGRMGEYQEEAARLGRRIKHLEEECEQLRKDMESQEIAL